MHGLSTLLSFAPDMFRFRVPFVSDTCARVPGDGERVGMVTLSLFASHGGRRSSVVKRVGIQIRRPLGSIPWRDWVRGKFFLCPGKPSESTLVQTYLCLPPTPLSAFVCTARTQICAHVKELISICRKRVSLNSRWYGNPKTRHTRGGGGGGGRLGGESWVAPYYGCSLSPGESRLHFPCIALGQDKNVI